MQRAEARFGVSMDQLLRGWYVDEGLKLDEIGVRLGISKGAVSRWLERFDIETRRGGRRAA